MFDCKWPLARVVKVFHGEDGRVRIADVRTERGGGGGGAKYGMVGHLSSATKD